jgi:hypothetical protein
MMNNRPAARSVGWNLGILSGLFAVVQVMISTAAARANIDTIASMRWALARLETGGGNPLPLIDSLATVVLITYAAMIITGAISLILSWHAGRLTAYMRGNRSGGAGAGFRVALLSGGIWIGFSIIISLLLHGDGTITGILASTPDGSALPAQLGGLLLQEAIFAAIGLGLGAWAGHLGAGSARLAETPPMAMVAPSPSGAYGVYPVSPYQYPVYAPLASYPANGGYPLPTAPYAYPVPPASASTPAYPPPPNYYHANGAEASTIAPQPPDAPQQLQTPQSAPGSDDAASQPSAE